MDLIMNFLLHTVFDWIAERLSRLRPVTKLLAALALAVMLAWALWQGGAVSAWWFVWLPGAVVCWFLAHRALRAAGLLPPRRAGPE